MRIVHSGFSIFGGCRRSAAILFIFQRNAQIYMVKTMKYEITEIDLMEIEKRARIERARAMKSGLASLKAAVASLFSGAGFSNGKAA